MTLRTRILLVVGSIVLVVGGVILYLVYTNVKKNTAPPADTTGNVIDQDNFNQSAVSGQAAGTPATGIPVKLPTTEEAEKNAVRQLAKIFIERYGSYSSDSDYQNIKDVEGLVTPQLWNVLSSKIGKKITSQSFVGATVSAVSTELSSWQTDKAEVTIMLRKIEEKNGGSVTSNQNATVDMVKIGEAWLVEKFEIK